MDSTTWGLLGLGGLLVGSLVRRSVERSKARSLLAYDRVPYLPDAPVVAVDVDEVLGFFVSELAKFHNARHGTQLNMQSFDNYDFSQVWGGSREDTDEKMTEFFASAYFRDIPTVPAARAVLKGLTDRVNFVVVTSRHAHLEAMTCDWLQRHFPGIFSDIVFGNIWAATGPKMSKPDLCKKLNATLLIDDNAKYALQCSKVPGFEVILLNYHGQYHWSDYLKTPPGNVHRVFDWWQVGEHLEQWLQRQK